MPLQFLLALETKITRQVRLPTYCPQSLLHVSHTEHRWVTSRDTLGDLPIQWINPR